MTEQHKNVDTQRVPNRDINAGERVVLALKLRASKMTYDAIAKQCGYGSASACHKAIKREMNRVIVKHVETLREEESLLLDQMQTECYLLFMDRKNTYRLYAADRLLAISEARRKLFGLDSKPDDLPRNLTVVRETPVGYFPPKPASNGNTPAREVTS